MKLKGLTEAAENYHVVLEENRRLYNEVQDLKGIQCLAFLGCFGFWPFVFWLIDFSSILNRKY